MTLKSRIRTHDGMYDSDKARQLFYDHLPNLRDKADEVVIDGVTGLKYRANLYGLYYHLNIDQRLWNLTSLINKFDHTTEISELTTLLVPNRAQVQKLIQSLHASNTSSVF